MLESTAKELEKMLYTTSKPDATEHTCVIVLDKDYAITYRHGPHSSLEEGSAVTLYNVLDPTLSVETTVFAISRLMDIVLLKVLSGEFASIPAQEPVDCGMAYKQLGVSSNREPTWKDGAVSDRDRSPFYVGSEAEKSDIPDSGFGIFDSDTGKLFGVSIENDYVDFSNCNEALPYGAIANPHPQIIGMDIINSLVTLKSKYSHSTSQKR